MQIRHIKVSNFRGIASLDWKPGSPYCCLIGAGDTGKSTLLDAIEAVLSSRWFSFAEPDFLGSNTSRPIVVEATIGELSRALKSDERFGFYIRGWTTAGELRDEPEDNDEPVLTVRLGLARRVGVVRRRGDRQYLADRLDPVAVAMIVNERFHRLKGRSSSAWAKYADALRRISLACRSSRTSRSSALMRAPSAVVRPDRAPASRSP